MPRGTWDLSSLTRGQRSNPCFLQWKRRFLTVGPPGSPQKWFLVFWFFVCLFVFGHATQLGCQFPNQGLNPEPPQ